VDDAPPLANVSVSGMLRPETEDIVDESADGLRGTRSEHICKLIAAFDVV